MINFQRQIDKYRNGFRNTAKEIKYNFESLSFIEVFDYREVKGVMRWDGESKHRYLSHFLTLLIKDSQNHKRLKDLKESKLLLEQTFNLFPYVCRTLDSGPSRCIFPENAEEQKNALSLIKQAKEKFESFMENDFEFLLQYILKKSLKKVKI